MGTTSGIGRKLLKETLIYSIGSFGSKVLSFLLIPFYTYFLTKRDLGEYDLLITSISLIVPLVSLQVSDSVYRWLITNKDVEYRKGIITNSFIILGWSICAFLIIFGFVNLFYEVTYSFYFVTLIILNSVLPFLQNILRGIGQTKKFALNGLITTFITVALTFILIYFFDMSVKGILIANVVSYLATSLIICYQISVFESFDFRLKDSKLIKQLLTYSLPLIPNLMSWWAISSASKFVILKYLGPEANGLYAVASRFPALLVVINSVLLLPLQDAVLKDENNKMFNQLLMKFIIFEITLATILGVLSPWVTGWLVADEYYESWKYMPMLYLGVCFNAIAGFLGLYYQRVKNTMKITLTTFIGALISLGLSLSLIETFGLLGISISFMVGFLIMFLLRYFDIFRINGLNRNLVIIISLIILSFIVFYLLPEEII